jgi:hypothetical protein
LIRSDAEFGSADAAAPFLANSPVRDLLTMVADLPTMGASHASDLNGEWALAVSRAARDC